MSMWAWDFHVSSLAHEESLSTIRANEVKNTKKSREEQKLK